MACSVVHSILIPVLNKDVVARMAFVLTSVEKIVSLNLVSAALRTADGLKVVPLQRETETILLPAHQGLIGGFSDRQLQCLQSALSFFLRNEAISNLRIEGIPFKKGIRLAQRE